MGFGVETGGMVVGSVLMAIAMVVDTLVLALAIVVASSGGSVHILWW